PSSRTPPDDAVPSPPGHRLLSYPPLFQLAGDRTAETAEQCRAGSVRTPWRRAPAERSELGGGGPAAVVAGQHDRLLRGVEPERPALAAASPRWTCTDSAASTGTARRTTASAIGPRSAWIAAEVTVPTTFPSESPRRTSPPAAA